MMMAEEEVAPVEAEWMHSNENYNASNSTDNENSAQTASNEDRGGEQQQEEQQQQQEQQQEEQQQVSEETGNGNSNLTQEEAALARRSSLRFTPRRESGVAFIPGTEKIADTGAVEEQPHPEQYHVIEATHASIDNSNNNGSSGQDASSSTEQSSSSSSATDTSNSGDGGASASAAIATSNDDAAAASNADTNNNEQSSAPSTIVATMPEEVRQEAPILENVDSNNKAAETITESSAGATDNTAANGSASAGAAASSASEVVEQMPRKESASATPPHRSSVAGRYVEPKAAFCTIEARTQSGESFSFSDVKWNTTIKELKAIVYTKHKKFDVDEIRLLKGGKPLDDENATIESLGFKNKEMVFVIRRLRGVNGDSASAPAPSVQQQQQQQQMQQQQHNQAASQGDVVTVQCPVGHGPGSRLRIRPAGREPMLVTVPPGVAPGGYFRVMLPPLDGGHAQQQQQQQQNHQQQQRNQQPGGGAPKPKIMAVTCPPGLRPGDMMEVLVPGVGRMRVPIPRGVAPGQDFRFRLPD